MQPIHPRITVDHAHMLHRMVQLGGHDGLCYPKSLRWHPTQQVIALTYPLLKPAMAERLALWTAQGRCLKIITAPLERLNMWYSCGWSADGRFFALGLTTIDLYIDAQTWVRRIPGQQVEWSPRGHILATNEWQRIVLWNLAEGRKIVLQDSGGLRLGQNSTFCWADGTHYLGASPTQIIWWDRRGAVLARYALHPLDPPPYSRSLLGWSPDGEYLVMWNDTSVVLVNRQAEYRCILPSSTIASFNIPLAWHPSGNSIATIDDCNVQQWTLDGRLLRSFNGHEYGIACLAWSPDGQLLATASLNSRICLWSADGVLLRTIAMHQHQSSALAIYLLAWSADGCYLAASLRDCSVHLYAIQPEP